MQDQTREQSPGGGASASPSPPARGMGVPAPNWRGRAPIWRIFLVFMIKWTAAIVLLFIIASVVLVIAYRWINPPPTWNMAGAALSGVDVRREWTSIENISPQLVRAVISAEDSRFCEHDGFDMEEIRRAIAEQDDRGYLRGASTISQQTAKNAFLFNGGGLVRKGFEAWFTLLIEQMWPKKRIMEIYLNVAEWGDGIYGAEAAARLRFEVKSSDLSRRQAALLAAVLPSPNKWRVDPPGRYVSRRAGQIEARMGIVRRDGLADCVLGPPKS